MASPVLQKIRTSVIRLTEAAIVTAAIGALAAAQPGPVASHQFAAPTSASQPVQILSQHP